METKSLLRSLKECVTVLAVEVAPSENVHEEEVAFGDTSEIDNIGLSTSTYEGVKVIVASG